MTTPTSETTTATGLSKGAIIEQLRAQFKSLEVLGSSLTAKEWYASASLPGWAVIDVYAHIIGSESMLEGYELPYVKLDIVTLDHVNNEIGEINETWIESLSHLGPEAILDRYRRVTATRLRSLEAMSQQAFTVATETPLGAVPYQRLMQIRAFDCWMHEQDIREGLGRPGHESGPCARAAVAEAVRALVAVVGAAVGEVRGDKADSPAEVTVTIELTGPIKQEINIVTGQRVEVVAEPAGAVTARIAMSSSLFMRLAGGRSQNLSPRLGSIDFGGDLELATRIATNLAFTT